MARKAACAVYSAAEFTSKMEAFIAACEAGGFDATDYRLIQYFDISPVMLDKYRAGDIKKRMPLTRRRTIWRRCESWSSIGRTRPSGRLWRIQS